MHTTTAPETVYHWKKLLIAYSEKHLISPSLYTIGTIDASKSVNSPRGHLFCLYFKYGIQLNKLHIDKSMPLRNSEIILAMFVYESWNAHHNNQ